MSPTYVYGLVPTDTELPPNLVGLSPAGRVSMIAHGRVAAVVSEAPAERPLGTRDDLLAHEAVVDALAACSAVIPMRFPAVVEESGVVDELLEPHHDRFVAMLADLEGRVQFTLKGRYEEDVVLREVIKADEQIRALQASVRDVPEDASYYDRIRLGELMVQALEAKRDADSEQILERLQPLAVATAVNQPAKPADVINSAFLVDRDRRREFEDAVEAVGKDFDGRAHLRLLGPLAPYDFVPEE